MRAVANACGRKRTIALGQGVVRQRSVRVRLKLYRCGRHVLRRNPRGVRVRMELRAIDPNGRQAHDVKRTTLKPAGR